MKRILISIILIVLMLLSSCRVFISNDLRADARMEQIISAIKGNDKVALKTLFSKKALDEAVDIDSEIDFLFDFIQGDIVSWERDGWASDGKIDHGKRFLMIRFRINIKTDKEEYRFFVMDYNMDTINPDNEGMYMLEVCRASYEGIYLGWQERMRGGIDIRE